MGAAGFHACSADGETLDEYEDKVGLTSSGGVSGAARRWCGSRQFNTPIWTVGCCRGARVPYKIGGWSSSKVSRGGLVEPLMPRAFPSVIFDGPGDPAWLYRYTVMG